jgi:hypothetical protein
MSAILGPDGKPMGATPEAPAPVEVIEVPIPPKENAEIKDAHKEQKDLTAAYGEVAKVVIGNLAAAFELLHRLGENEERIQKAHQRAIKSTGVHADRVMGFRPERGMLVMKKRDSQEGN